MTAPIRSMPVPAPQQVIATIRCYDDLLDALRTIKAVHGLSNAWCDEIGGLVHGHTDKVLGPAALKGLSRLTLDIFMQLFAIKMEMTIDLDQARRMEARWEKRDAAQVKVNPARVSQAVIDRAKPLVLKEAGRAGGLATASKRTPALRAESARKAGQARAAKLTSEERSAMMRKGWETRRKAAPDDSIHCSPECISD